MKEQLSLLVTASLDMKYKFPDGKPLYQLQHKVDEGKDKDSSSRSRVAGAELVPFEPKELTAEMLQDDGSLHPNLLYFCCLHPSCQRPTKALANCYPVRPKNKERAFTKDGSARLSSFDALVQSHHSRVHGGPAAKQQVVTKMAQAFTTAAAAMQMPQMPQPKMPATAQQEQHTDEPTLTPAERQGTVLALRLPFPVPKDTRAHELESTLTVAQLGDMITPGKMVSTDAYDMLRQLEMKALATRAENEGLSELADRVLCVSVHDVLRLDLPRCRALKLEDREAAGGPYDQLRAKLGFDQTDPLEYLLVLFGTHKNLHCAEAFWLPSQNEIFHVDSLQGCGLEEEVTTAVIKPFADYLMEQAYSSVSDVIVVSKGASEGIEPQGEGSNVCAFASTLFIAEAVRLLFKYVAMPAVAEEQEDGEEQEEEADGTDAIVRASKWLATTLRGLKTSALQYERKRRSAKTEILQLRKEYLEYVAKHGLLCRSPPHMCVHWVHWVTIRAGAQSHHSPPTFAQMCNPTPRTR